MKPTWKNVADLLWHLEQIFQAEWRCGFPSADSVPTAELDALVDEWALKLAENMGQRLSPPPPVRPWLLARVAVALSAARREEAAGKPFPDERLSPKFFWNILIWEWNNGLRDGWLNHGSSGNYSFSE